MAVDEDLLQPKSEVCLHALDALRHEIDEAMSAVSANTLQALEESLWRQEVLCVGLKRMLGTLQGNSLQNGATDRIKAAMTALHAVNRTYAEVVEQSRSSNHRLYALCLSYRGATPRDTAASTGMCCSLEV